jgi:hypothetical protein
MLVTRLLGMKAGLERIRDLRMSEAAEYRALADECLGWAKSARSDRECRIFLQMAETWLEAAAIAERRGTRVPATGVSASLIEPSARSASDAGSEPACRPR